ncbi:MAG: S8 family serine peptidase [Fimbriimonadales bacterium]|nr:S8 family serine peptidase [Fimbriimonadales bacterium]
MHLQLVALALLAWGGGGAPPSVGPFRPGLPPLPIPRGPKTETIPGYVLVKTSQGTARAVSSLALQPIAPPVSLVPGGRLVSRIADTGWTLWALPRGQSVETAIREARRNPLVAYAQPLNRIYPLWEEPNDPDFRAIERSPDLIMGLEGEEGEFRRLWHLTDTLAEEAWSNFPDRWWTALTKPAGSPVIAVVDTGCDMNHPDFRNAGGTSSNVANGGQLDWSRSKQFRLGAVFPSGSPEDRHGHGTHVAGLALASGNNGGFDGHGVIGTGYNATGMILRVFDDSGTGTDADAAAAIFYAADNGADIINLSLGTENYSQIFQDAVTYAFQKGCLVVAAGNEDGGGGGDLGPIYPAACSGSLGVSANGPDLIPATSTYSGFGYYVDVAAPGGDAIIAPDLSSFKIQFVFSTAMRTPGTLWNLSQQGVLYPPYNLNYAYLAGTSMATPIVAGAAALFLDKFGLRRDSGWANVRAYRAIERSAIGVMGAPYGGWEPYQGYGSLNIAALLEEDDFRGAETGAVEGIVYYGATPVANVSVRARLVSGGITYTTTTQRDGTYRFEALPPGVYQVTAAPFGAAKTKRTVVHAGSDTPGFDFWCGTFTWDDTDPTIVRFQLAGDPEPNRLVLRHWAYDTETGLDRLVVRIGTTAGGTDVLDDTEVVIDGPEFELSGFTLPSGTSYLRATYTAGSGRTSSVTIPINLATARTVSGTVILGDFVGSLAGIPVEVQIRNPGSTVAVETHTVLLSATGGFSLTTTRSGTFDLAFKASHWLRQKVANVALVGSTVSGLLVSLPNGDCNGDNTVNLADLNAISRAWRSVPGGANWDPNADLNGDRTVNLADRNIVARNWRMSGAP